MTPNKISWGVRPSYCNGNINKTSIKLKHRSLEAELKQQGNITKFECSTWFSLTRLRNLLAVLEMMSVYKRNMSQNFFLKVCLFNLYIISSITHVHKLEKKSNNCNSTSTWLSSCYYWKILLVTEGSACFYCLKVFFIDHDTDLIYSYITREQKDCFTSLLSKRTEKST